MEKKIYAAYGSNMDLERMAKRCHEAEPFGTGMIKGCKLSFRQSKSGYYASLDKADGASTPVVLWLISDEDEYLLDMCEGYPIWYRKCELEVELSDIYTDLGRPRTVQAVVYVLPETQPLGEPMISYGQLLKAAYRRFGFDRKILEQALTECKPYKEH